MKFSASILSTLVLASGALAAPGTALRRSRAAHKSNPINRINKPELTNVTEVSYSSNWAGAVLIGTGYTSVTGTFTVPSPTTAGSGVCLFTSSSSLSWRIQTFVRQRKLLTSYPNSTYHSISLTVHLVRLGRYRRRHLRYCHPSNRCRLDTFRLKDHLRCLV